MGVVHIQPSRLNGLGAPEVIDAAPTSAASFTLGAPVQRNSSDGEQLEEFAGGATVTGLVGFALQAVASGVPDFGDTVQIAVAEDGIVFLGQVYDVSGTAVVEITGDGTYTGNQYGLVKDSNGDWYVDEEDETNVHVQVIKELPEWNAVLFKVIPSVIGI